MELQRQLKRHSILMCLLLVCVFGAGLETGTKSLDKLSVNKERSCNDFKVSNEFLGVEEKPSPSPVVSTRNLILMMVKAASAPVLDDVRHDEEDQDQDEDETDAFHKSPQGKGRRLEGVWRRDRFYYCGPKNKSNSCSSLCYAFGYPRITCGKISCYCTW